tara:strand:- start:9532 stop:10485 length:954 start_codon:yes stop_codon:yes gene_type:complete
MMIYHNKIDNPIDVKPPKNIGPYYQIFILIFSIILGFRPFDFGTDYESYKYMYETLHAVDPLLFLINITFSSLGIPFEIIFTILSYLAMYNFIYSLSYFGHSGRNKLFSFTMFVVLQISAHWRIGLALSLLLFLLRKNNSNTKTFFYVGFMHISSLFLSVLSFFKMNYLFIIIASVAFYIVYYELLILIDPVVFEPIGRQRAFMAIVTPEIMDEEIVFIHRSLWYLTNIRIYFVVSILFILMNIKNKNNLVKVTIIGYAGYIIFAPNALIAQKGLALIYPLTILAGRYIENSNNRLLFYLAVFTSGIYEISRRVNLV